MHAEGVVAVADVGPLADADPVVEQRNAVRFDLDLAGDASSGPEQNPGGSRVGGRPPVVGAPGPAVHLADNKQVLDDQPPGGCVPGRLDHHGAGHVAAVVGNHGARRSKPEGPGCAVEQGPEDARRVRPGQAQPFDRAVWGNQAAVFAVGEECILGDRRVVVHILILPCSETGNV